MTNSFSKISKILILLLIITVFFKNDSQANAQVVLFEDDFSNGFEKWQSVRDNFDLWSIIDEQAHAYIDTGSTLAELVPKDIYWNPNWKNIVYELDYQYLQGADKNISFGFKDVRNWYEIHFIGTNYIISHVKDGRVVWHNSGYQRIFNNILYRISISLNEGHIIVKVDGEEITNVVDPTFDNDYGKIGIKAGAGAIFPTHSVYDNILVTSIIDIAEKLNIVPQKQTDPEWKDEEYDSATEWIGDVGSEDPGIGAWGCLVTSVSMVMNYHGINQMPNGDVVNPSTINTWLKSQEDGFVGSGLVNWLAITRLTKEINNNFATPKFEYKRNPGPEINVGTEQIALSNPVILEIPGHFLVGNGIVDGEVTEGESSDLYITDPAFSYEKLSEHQTELRSTRTLTPTFTDLSYLHISHDKNLEVILTKSDGSEVDNLQKFDEYIDEFLIDDSLPSGGEKGQQSKILEIIEVEKPNSGNYLLEVSQESLGNGKINIFAYGKDGTLSNLSYAGLIGRQKLIFEIQYDADGASSIYPKIDFKTLSNDLAELNDLGEINKQYARIELQKYINFAKNSNQENKLRYTEALDQLIDWYQDQLSKTSEMYLKQRLNEIKGIIQG